MGIYGGLISAPLGHVLITLLQWLFAGRTSVKSKVLQILVSNLVVRTGSHLVVIALTKAILDCANPELHLPNLNGHHRRRPKMASS